MPDPFRSMSAAEYEFEHWGEPIGEAYSQMSQAIRDEMEQVRAEAIKNTGIGLRRVQESEAAWREVAARAARSISPSGQVFNPETGERFGGGATSGAGGGLTGWWGRLGGMKEGPGGAKEGTLFGLWRARAIQREGQQLQRLGRQIEQTAREWADYYRQVDRAQDVMDRVTAATTGVTLALEEQLEPTERLAVELGEHLAPYYETLATAGDELKTSLIEASDGMQSLVAIGTVAVSTFLKVAGGVVATLGSLAALKILAASVAQTLGMTVATLGSLAVGLGVIGVALVTVGVLTTKTVSSLQGAANTLGDFAAKWELSAGDIARLARAYYDDLNLVQKAMFNLAGGMDAFLDRMKAGTDELGTVYEQAVKAAYSLVPAAAAAFSDAARTQESIQNEMLTKQREYERALEEIQKYGASERAMGDLNRRGAELRRLELSLEEQKQAAKRALGAIVIQWIDAAAQIGMVDPMEAIEMKLDTMLGFGMASEAGIEAGRGFQGYAGLFGQREISFGEMLEGMGAMASGGTAGIMANLPEMIEGITLPAEKQTVAIENNTEAIEDLTTAINNVPAWGYGYLPLPDLKTWEDRTVADELRTQGPRTR